MNEDRFTGLAGIYAKYRPSYPDAFLRYLYSEAGLKPNAGASSKRKAKSSLCITPGTVKTNSSRKTTR